MHSPVAGQPFMSRLTDAELFVLCASRAYRASRESPASRCPCLPRLFGAVGLKGALPAFLQFQIALSADPDRTLTFEERHARFIGDGEMALLQALYAWQCDAACDPRSVLWYIRVRAVRRVAADAGREFALQMGAAGWILPLRGCYRSPGCAGLPASAQMHRIARGVH